MVCDVTDRGTGAASDVNPSSSRRPFATPILERTTQISPTNGRNPVSEMPDYSTFQFRDRDIFHDIDRRVFVTLGYIQPDDKVLSYLKYIPDQNGKWLSGTTRYKRIFSGGIDSVIEGNLKIPEHYIHTDPHFGADVLEVPKSDISNYFNPENRLGEIVSQGAKDPLEEKIIMLTEALLDGLNLSLSNLGITGSVAWGAHNPEWSDININIYGFKESWYLYNNYNQVADQKSDIRLRLGKDWSSTMNHLKSRVSHLSDDDLLKLYARRTELILDEYMVTIMPILLPQEAPIRHGSEQYITISKSPIDIEMRIDDCKYGIFHPAIYKGHSKPVDEDIEITRLMMYDGSFRGMLREGDLVHIRGTLQKAKFNSKSSEDIYQIMVGTKQGIGNEFVRIVE
jgi:predicted nucleotidyltransferase